MPRQQQADRGNIENNKEKQKGRTVCISKV